MGYGKVSHLIWILLYKTFPLLTEHDATFRPAEQ